MKERRKYNRVTIPLPVLLGTITLGRKKILDLVTRDISASGTFITTQTSFPEGTRFILDLTRQNDNLKEVENTQNLKGLTGSMVRSTPNGLAIQFDTACQIESLRALSNALM